MKEITKKERMSYVNSGVEDIKRLFKEYINKEHPRDFSVISHHQDIEIEYTYLLIEK